MRVSTNGNIKNILKNHFRIYYYSKVNVGEWSNKVKNCHRRQTLLKVTATKFRTFDDRHPILINPLILFCSIFCRFLWLGFPKSNHFIWSSKVWLMSWWRPCWGWSFVFGIGPDRRAFSWLNWRWRGCPRRKGRRRWHWLQRRWWGKWRCRSDWFIWSAIRIWASAIQIWSRLWQLVCLRLRKPLRRVTRILILTHRWYS